MKRLHYMAGRFTNRRDEVNPVVCARNNFLFGHVINPWFTKSSVKIMDTGLVLSVGVFMDLNSVSVHN